MFRKLKYDSLSELSDLELVEKYKISREKNYVAELFQRYRHLVFGVALKYLKKEAESHDITMVIFERLLTKLDTYTVNNVKNWIYTMTKNECLSKIKEHNRKSEFEKKYTDLEKISPKIMENDGFIRLTIEADENQRIHKLRNAIALLRVEQRRCIEAFYLREKSYKEVSEETGFPINKVKSYLQNGKRKLAKIMSEST